MKMLLAIDFYEAVLPYSSINCVLQEKKKTKPLFAQHVTLGLTQTLLM